MTNLIKINFESEDRPTVSGRELHDALEVKTAYKDWFPRMCEYGFEENRDYLAIAQKRATAQGNMTKGEAKKATLYLCDPSNKNFQQRRIWRSKNI